MQVLPGTVGDHLLQLLEVGWDSVLRFSFLVWSFEKSWMLFFLFSPLTEQRGDTVLADMRWNTNAALSLGKLLILILKVQTSGSGEKVLYNDFWQCPGDLYNFSFYDFITHLGRFHYVCSSRDLLFSLVTRSTFASIISFTNRSHLSAAQLLYPLYIFVPLALCRTFSLPVLIRVGIISVNKREQVSPGGRKGAGSCWSESPGAPCGTSRVLWERSLFQGQGTALLLGQPQEPPVSLCAWASAAVELPDLPWSVCGAPVPVLGWHRQQSTRCAAKGKGAAYSSNSLAWL